MHQSDVSPYGVGDVAIWVRFGGQRLPIPSLVTCLVKTCFFVRVKNTCFVCKVVGTDPEVSAGTKVGTNTSSRCRSSQSDSKRLGTRSLGPDTGERVPSRLRRSQSVLEGFYGILVRERLKVSKNAAQIQRGSELPQPFLNWLHATSPTQHQPLPITHSDRHVIHYPNHYMYTV